MRAVNLLPREASNQKFAIDRALVVAVAVTLFVVVAVVGGFFLEKANAATDKKQLAAAQAALTRAETQQPSGHSGAPARLQIPVVLSQQEPWHVALDSALSTRVAWDVLLKQLEYVVPDKISLTTVTLGSSAGATTGTTGGSISLAGDAFSDADIANFLSTLARVQNVSQVTLVSSATNIGSKVITFQITADFNVPATMPVTAPAVDTTTTTGG